MTRPGPTPRSVVVRGLVLALAFLLVVAAVEALRGRWAAVTAEVVLAAVGGLAGLLLLRRMR